MLNLRGLNDITIGKSSGMNHGEPHGLPVYHAQENPPLDEQPERAPDGIDGWPDPIRKLDDEMVFLTSRL